eukprot:4549083-Amphidinium_carterae.1
MLTARNTWSPLPGSVPSTLFVEMSNSVTALIVRRPLSGMVPLKLFVKILKMLTARITLSPLPGSAPSKLFVEIEKFVTALIVRMPPLKFGISQRRVLVRLRWKLIP